jgi:ribosome-associated translation inhibitor RaiA
VDRVLDEAERAISEGVREMACRLNRASTSFQQTAENLARAAHLNVSKETLRQLIVEEGKAVLKAQQRGELTPDWDATDCRTSHEKTRVYLGCDGVMVPLVTAAEKHKRRAQVKEKRQKRGRRCRPLPPRKEGADQAYKEFKLGVLYDEEQKRRYVAATSGDHAVAGRMLQRMALQIRLPEAQEKIGIADGSPWIRNEIELYGLVDDLGLDYYHLRENVQKARLAVYGEQSAQGQAWREGVMGLFYERGYDVAWDRLVAWRSTLRGGKREAADRLLSYVAERRETIRYPQFRSRGWQIGSGPTEAQCKACTQRLKGRGRRWDRANAEALMALDCLHNSHAWHLYWTTLDPTMN